MPSNASSDVLVLYVNGQGDGRRQGTRRIAAAAECLHTRSAQTHSLPGLSELVKRLEKQDIVLWWSDRSLLQ